MIDSLPHLLNIGTLATWLSVAGFGTVGILVPDPLTMLDSRPLISETQVIARDFTLGGAAPSDSSDSSDPLADPVPVPPEMPELTELAPLPALPESLSIRPTAPVSAVASSPRRSVRHPAAAASGEGTALSNAARLAAGNMPPPDYPAEARRRGQSGTLLVEFIVDASGRVLTASAITPSPWPLLNEEAIRAARRWTFPPGAVMKLQRPIVFQLR